MNPATARRSDRVQLQTKLRLLQNEALYSSDQTPEVLRSQMQKGAASELFQITEIACAVYRLSIDQVSAREVEAVVQRSTSAMAGKHPKLTPDFEHDLMRDARLAYELLDASEFVRCVEYGSPTPLERWHAVTSTNGS